MHEMKQKEDSMKVRIGLRLFVQHSITFCPRKITRVTDTSKDAEFQKSKRHLKENYQQLKNENQKRSQIVPNNKSTIMKPAVLNLTGKTINKNVASLLNLGLNFVPTLDLYRI